MTALASSIVGQRFGCWTVLREVSEHGLRPRAQCRCDCGFERAIMQGRIGRTLCQRCVDAQVREELHACGLQTPAPVRECKVGERYASWTVERLVGGEGGARAWCRCECGAERLTRAQVVVRGMGCLSCEKREKRQRAERGHDGAVLAYLQRHVGEHGIAPKTEEIAQALGSTAYAVRMSLAALERRRVIKRERVVTEMMHVLQFPVQHSDRAAE